MSLEHVKAYFNQDNNIEVEEHQEEEQKQVSPILKARMEREQAKEERHQEIGENIKVSQRLRAKITKSIKDNRPADEILIDCIKCISLMTDDKTFYKQNMKHLKDRD